MSRKTSVERVNEVERILRDKIYQKWNSLRDAFRGLDRSNNGRVTLEDLRGALHDLLQVDDMLSDDELAMLEDRFDQTKDGVISYEEFVVALTKAKGTGLQKAGELSLETDEILVKVKDKLDEKYNSTWAAFLDMDTDRTGTISRREFRNGIEKLVEWHTYNGKLTLDELSEALFERYDLSKDGRIHYWEFIKAMETSAEYGLHIDRAYVRPAQTRAFGR